VNKIILDSTIGLGGDSVIADKLAMMGYDVEIRNFPNKESILESDAPVFLGGQTMVMAYEDKNYDDFKTWLKNYHKKLGTLTILSEIELFHPKRIGILKKIDNTGTPCRILSPWKFNDFTIIKEYHHDLNASFIDLDYLISKTDSGAQSHLAFCNTTIKDSRPGRAELIEKLRSIKNIKIDLEGPKHQISTSMERHPTKIPLQDYNDSQLEIVCETDSQSDEIFYPTEKIYKPISAGHPFMVLAPQYFLRSLRAKGFKTFNKIFDESYDEIADQHQRIDKIYKILKQMNQKDIKKSCRAITRHNQRRLFEIVVSADLIFAKKLKKIVDLAIKEHQDL